MKKRNIVIVLYSPSGETFTERKKKKTKPREKLFHSIIAVTCIFPMFHNIYIRGMWPAYVMFSGSRWRVSTWSWAFTVSTFICLLFEDLCVLMMWNWKICFMRNKNESILEDFECHGLDVFLPLYKSLYIEYVFAIVYSCNIIRGNKWFGWMDGLDQVDLWNRISVSNQEASGLVWTGAQIGDSSEEVEKWAANPDLGSPNIQ